MDDQWINAVRIVFRDTCCTVHSRSLLLLFGLVAILVNVLVNVRQSSDDACAQSAPVNVHVRTVVPSTVTNNWQIADCTKQYDLKPL